MFEQKLLKLVGKALLEATQTGRIEYDMPVEYYLSILTPAIQASTEEVGNTNDKNFEDFKVNCQKLNLAADFDEIMRMIESEVEIKEQQKIINEFAKKLINI